MVDEIARSRYDLIFMVFDAVHWTHIKHSPPPLRSTMSLSNLPVRSPNNCLTPLTCFLPLEEEEGGGGRGGFFCVSFRDRLPVALVPSDDTVETEPISESSEFP